MILREKSILKETKMKGGEDWKVLIKNNGEGARRYPRLMKFASA